jgi:hypothetical protein
LFLVDEEDEEESKAMALLTGTAGTSCCSIGEEEILAGERENLF